MTPALLITAIAYGFGFVGSMPLAGPVAVLLVSRSAQKKYGEAIRIALGACVAESAYAGLAFFGFTTFLAHHDWVLPASHAVTAVLLIVLGLYFVRWNFTEKKDDEKHAHRTGSFFVGLSISSLNPTLIATWSAVTAALYSRIHLSFERWMAIPFGLAAGAGTVTWHIVLVLLLRHFGDRFPKRALTWAVRIMGALLCVLGVISGITFVKYLLHPHHG